MTPNSIHADDFGVEHAIESQSDLMLKGQIIGQLLKENFIKKLSLDNLPIVLKIHAGNVIVSGVVSSPTEANRILSIVQPTLGVKGVQTDFIYDNQ